MTSITRRDAAEKERCGTEPVNSVMVIVISDLERPEQSSRLSVSSVCVCVCVQTLGFRDLEEASRVSAWSHSETQQLYLSLVPGVH